MNGPAIADLPTEFQIFYWSEAIAEWVQVGAPISAESAEEAMAKLAPQAFGSYRVTPVGKPDWNATFHVILAESQPPARRPLKSHERRLFVRAALDRWIEAQEDRRLLRSLARKHC